MAHILKPKIPGCALLRHRSAHARAHTFRAVYVIMILYNMYNTYRESHTRNMHMYVALCGIRVHVCTHIYNRTDTV